MDDGAMVVASLGILCSTGVLCTLLLTIRAAFTRRPDRGRDELTEEIRALRVEMQALRQQNNELMLGFDSALDHTNRRLGRLEAQKELPSESIEAANQPIFR